MVPPRAGKLASSSASKAPTWAKPPHECPQCGKALQQKVPPHHPRPDPHGNTTNTASAARASAAAPTSAGTRPRTPRGEAYKCRDCGKAPQRQPHHPPADHTGEKPFRCAEVRQELQLEPQPPPAHQRTTRAALLVPPVWQEPRQPVQPEHAPGNPHRRPYGCKGAAELQLQLNLIQAPADPHGREATSVPAARGSARARPHHPPEGPTRARSPTSAAGAARASAAAPTWPRTADPPGGEALQVWECGKLSPGSRLHGPTRAFTGEKPYECRTCGEASAGAPTSPEAPADPTQARSPTSRGSAEGLQPALPTGGAPADPHGRSPTSASCGRASAGGSSWCTPREPTWGTALPLSRVRPRASAGIGAHHPPWILRVRSPTSAPSAARASATASAITHPANSPEGEALLTGQRGRDA